MNTSSKSDNFLAQFKDINSNSLKYFTAAQFVEVWNHYDTDGKLYFITVVKIMSKLKLNNHGILGSIGRLLGCSVRLLSSANP